MRTTSAAAFLASILAAGAARGEEPIGAYLKTAREDAILEARRGGYGPASGQYIGLPYLRDMEFRYRKDGLDVHDVRYTLRLDPRGFGEARAASETNQAELRRSRQRDRLLLNRALLDRYLQTVDFLMMTSIRRINGELIQVMEDKIRVLESRKATEDFAITDLIEAEAEVTKLRSQDLDMEKDLGVLEQQIALQLAGGKPPGGDGKATGFTGFDTTGLAEVDSIIAEVEKGAYALDSGHVYLEYLEENLAVAESRYLLEKAEGRRYVSYVSLGYDVGERTDQDERRDEGKDFDLSRAYIFEVGFRLPFITDGKQGLNRRKEDLLTEREDYAKSRNELESIMRKDLRDIRSLVVQHRYLRERETKVDAQASLKKYMQMAGVDPLALLAIKAANLKNRLKMEEVRYRIIMNWIKVLDAAGDLSREPLRNHLLSGAPELPQVKDQAAPLPVLERYELKYTVPRDLVETLSAFVEPYCSLDYHSSASPDGFYQVNSLYFDSPEHILLRNRLGGLHDRFNMRVRTYGAAPREPWFLEVKRKVGDTIRKYRARVRDMDLERILDPATDPREFLAAPGDAANAALFRRLAHVYNTSPVIQTTYRRKAYFSNCDDYARVTFDKGLRYMARDAYDPLPAEGAFAPSDLETVFDEGTDVVLELKCVAKNVPLWMVDLVRRFELRRRGFSKYSAGMSQVFRKYEFNRGERMPSPAPSGWRNAGWDEAGG